MDNCGTSLTVFFEDPFWIGIVERIEDGKLMAAKHVFGAEPTGIEILDYVKNHYDDLKFSPAVACDAGIHKMNPKRAVRGSKKIQRQFWRRDKIPAGTKTAARRVEKRNLPEPPHSKGKKGRILI